MTDQLTKPGAFFWIVAIFALVWNAMGAMNFVMQMLPGGIENLPERYQVLVNNRPTWATIAFGVGALTSVLGAIALLLRNRWAVALLMIAFFATLVTLLPTAPVQMASHKFSMANNAMTILLPIVISMLMAWYASRCRDKGWLS